MRCADRLLARTAWRIGVLAALCLSAAGCSSLGSMFKQVPLGGPPVTAGAATAPAASATPGTASANASANASATTPAPAPATTPAARAAAAAAATATHSAPGAGLPLVYGGAPEAPVTPALQRAYDDARRLMRAGSTAEAEKGLRALAQSNPELGGPHANLGALYRQAGKLPEAVAEGEKAVKANPKQPLYFNQLGITYRENGQFDKAREAYEAAISLDPAYASPLLNLGILHDLYLADGKRALELYDKYLALLPGGDAVVAKWVADLKNRKAPPPQPSTQPTTPPTAQPVTVSQKEKE